MSFYSEPNYAGLHLRTVVTIILLVVTTLVNAADIGAKENHVDNSVWLKTGTNLDLGSSIGIEYLRRIEISKARLEFGATLRLDHTTNVDNRVYERDTWVYKKYLFTAHTNWLYLISGATATHLFLGGGLSVFQLNMSKDRWIDYFFIDPITGELTNTESTQNEGIILAGMANLGVTQRISDRFDLRLALPIYLTFNNVGESEKLFSNILFSLGYHF